MMNCKVVSSIVSSRNVSQESRRRFKAGANRSSSAVFTTRGHGYQSFQSVHFSTMATAVAKGYCMLVMSGVNV
jgi:hypothetical protein